MPLFRVKQTQLCYVTFIHDVETNTIEEAESEVRGGYSEAHEHSVGDSYSLSDEKYETYKISD